MPVKRSGFKRKEPPLLQKPGIQLKRGKPMRRVSKKRAAYRASKVGQADLAWMGMVKQLPCCGCGTTVNVKAHHCKDKPPQDMEWIYDKLPYGCKSGPRDTIPLCEPSCHNFGPNSYHVNRPEFHRRNGFDYLHIQATRAAVEAINAEIDF